MAGNTDKNISFLICSALDNLGFKKQNVLFRSKHCEEVSTKFNCKAERNGFPLKLIPAGSAAEGLGLADSDNDFMIVIEDVFCVDHGSDNEYFFILETDYTNTAPGYTKVIYKNIDNTNQVKVPSFLSFGVWICNSLSVYRYVSSELFRTQCSDALKVFPVPNQIHHIDSEIITANGPAVTSCLQVGASVYERDLVYSVSFYGSNYLLKWVNRTRLHTWPTSDVIKKVSDLEGYIVPIGDKQSENQSLEWRICYTTAEKELVSSLSDIQIKVYVVLKLVARTLLKPICKALTSYVIKNVVFWVAETTHQKHFSSHYLVDMLLKSLRFIKYCLENNHFPNYMIPERNLFRGAVCGKEKQNLIRFLSKCLDEGGIVILRVPKLYHFISYIVTSPENVFYFGKWRDEVEKQAHLLVLKIQEHCDITSLNNPEVIFDIQREFGWDHFSLVSLVIPDLFSLYLTGISFREITELFHSRLRTIQFL